MSSSPPRTMTSDPDPIDERCRRGRLITSRPMARDWRSWVTREWPTDKAAAAPPAPTAPAPPARTGRVQGNARQRGECDVLLHAFPKQIQLLLLPIAQLATGKDASLRECVLCQAAGAQQHRLQRLTLFDGVFTGKLDLPAQCDLFLFGPRLN